MRLYSILIFVFLTGCADEVYDYEIKDAYEKCNQSLYSIEVKDYMNLYVNCSNGKLHITKRNQ